MLLTVLSLRLVFCTETRFPKDYPTGCLLGCVHMTDCLSQEQFKEQVSEVVHVTFLSNELKSDNTVRQVK